MTNTRIQPKNLSISDACTYANLGRSCIYELMKDGKFPAGFKVGKKRLIPIADVDAWLDQMQTSGMVH